MNIKQLLRKIVLKIRGEIGAVDADLQSAKRDISGLQSGLDLKADKSETYTKTETDSLLSSKADKSEVSEVDIDLEGTGTIVSIPENATGYGTIEKLGGKSSFKKQRITLSGNDDWKMWESGKFYLFGVDYRSILANNKEYTVQNVWNADNSIMLQQATDISNYGLWIRDDSFSNLDDFKANLNNYNLLLDIETNEIVFEYPTNVKVVGKNLYDFKDLKNDNISAYAMLYSNVIIKLTLGKTYTISFDSIGYLNKLQVSDVDLSNSIDIKTFYSSVSKRYSATFIATKELTNREKIFGFQSYQSGKFAISNIQLEQGEVVNSYSPYTEKNFPQTNVINYVSTQLQTNHSWTQENASKWLGLGVENDSNIINYANNKKGDVKYKIVDMGTLSFTYNSSANTFTTNINDIKQNTTNTQMPNILSTKFNPIVWSGGVWVDGSTCGMLANENIIHFYDTSYGTDTNAFKNAMQGVMLIYELATPIEIDLSSLETEEHFECESNGSIIHDSIANYKYSFPVSLKGQVELNFEHDKEQQRDIDNLKKEIDLKANDSELSSVAKGLDKSLYNLGAFDTISGNVITRQTGYLYGKDLFSLNVADYGNITYYKIPKPTGALDYGIYSYNAITNKYPKYQGSNWNSTECIGKISGYAEASYYWVGFTKGTTLAQALADFQDLVLQYKLATPYTEEIIEGQPLITLDSQGSQWLRSEWEKGLNLLPNSESVSGATQTVITEVVNLPIGTYTIKVSGGTYSGAMALNVNYDDGTSGSNIVAGNVGEPLTFTTSKVITTISVYCNSTISNVNFMLNEGTEPLPYQEYNGSIVREKQIEELKNEINSLKERIALLESK